MSSFAFAKIPLRVTGALATVAVIGLLLAGCGSSSLSHPKLVARADAACRTANSAVSQLGAPTASLSALKTYAAQLLPISQKLATNLSGLKASSSDQAALDKLVGAIKNGNKGLNQIKSASTTAAAISASKIITAQSVPAAANALGAGTCAVSPSA